MIIKTGSLLKSRVLVFVARTSSWPNPFVAVAYSSQRLSVSFEKAKLFGLEMINFLAKCVFSSFE